MHSMTVDSSASHLIVFDEVTEVKERAAEYLFRLQPKLSLAQRNSRAFKKLKSLLVVSPGLEQRQADNAGEIADASVAVGEGVGEVVGCHVNHLSSPGCVDGNSSEGC